MRIGVCLVPYAPQPWLQPIPTKKSWETLVRHVGVGDVRLQLDLALASPTPDVWNTSVFESWFRPAVDAGMRVHANIVSGVQIDAGGKVTAPVPAHHTFQFRQQKARDLAGRFGSDIFSWGIGNEPGFGEWMTNDISRGGSIDYIRNVYFGEFVAPVILGIRGPSSESDLNERITGFEADGPEIQQRCMKAAAELDMEIDAETVHPYGDVGGGDYATMKLFALVRDKKRKPWIVGEIDHQQMPGATSVATDEQVHALIKFIGDAHRDYPDLESVFLGTPEYFFTRKPMGWPFPPGWSWSTWTLETPELSTIGKEFRFATKLLGWY